MPRIMIMFAISLVLAACGEGYPAAGNAANCTDEECTAGQRCTVAGTCATPCHRDGDCADDEWCGEPLIKGDDTKGSCQARPEAALEVIITGIADNRFHGSPPFVLFMGEVENAHGNFTISWKFDGNSGAAEEINGRIWTVHALVDSLYVRDVFRVTATDSEGRTATAEQGVTLPAPYPPVPRLTVHFAADTPSGASAPASNETMVKAILSASLDENIWVYTLMFLMRATSPGLDNWALRWDNGPPGNLLDYGSVPDYSGGWVEITAVINRELSAGSNLAVSLYMDTQAMQIGDIVSLKIYGAEGVGLSRATASVTVPTATKAHLY